MRATGRSKSARRLADRAVRPARRLLERLRYRGSRAFWEDRYRTGGTSGPGSYGEFATFKAEVLNRFIATHQIRSVIEFGCGDGNQVSLGEYPPYIGLDVSPSAIERCRKRFAQDPSKEFFTYPSGAVTIGTPPFLCDLALSLDVIYHLTEEEVFERHMTDVFTAAHRFVALYTSDTDQLPGLMGAPHIRHRPVRRFVAERFPHWKVEEVVENRFPWNGDPRTSSWADFTFYSRVDR